MADEQPSSPRRRWTIAERPGWEVLSLGLVLAANLPRLLGWVVADRVRTRGGRRG
ncbi:hypothetical protein [Pseudoclavibacter sp. VKM Ac-2888]|uniref:hypothetical protein n=1 Tax=Pseudoclavibacter sp. VKM Ac-2888 TaxID=2783830 RepID=UPI00188A20E6|nr:hypothetical protein [Pseudoclavibacter sp. VKM Ac-2888]MBF4549492.1 hypothetical protein [Pseudoclavibacter sp. VKM Ac-2888]